MAQEILFSLALNSVNLNFLFVPSTDLSSWELFEFDFKNVPKDGHALFDNVVGRQEFLNLLFINQVVVFILHQVVVERLVPGVDLRVGVTGGLLLQFGQLLNIFLTFWDKSVNQVFLELLENSRFRDHSVLHNVFGV